MSLPTSRNLLAQLKARSTARIGMGRVGPALPTSATLDLQLSHARARDAVHAAIPKGFMADQLQGQIIIEVQSQARSREEYLLRPDYGRCLDPLSKPLLEGQSGELAIIMADGLSATATKTFAAPLAEAIMIRARGWLIAPLVVAHQARVAIADEIAGLMGARLSVILIGERPGLSSCDSLSAYITWQPEVGRKDSERNCISNIRPPHGLLIDDAADQIMQIASDARLCGMTGVALPAALARVRSGDDLISGPCRK